MFISGGVLRALCVIFLPLFILGFIFTLGFSDVINNSTHLEQAIQQSGFYNTFVNGLLDQATSASTADPLVAAIPINQPAIQSIINQAFPPNELAQDGNRIINGTYKWLRGDDNQPNFRVDLTPNKQQLANNLAAYAHQHLASLPACDPNVDISSYNVFTATCVPSNFDINLATQAVQQQVTNTTDFLGQPILTSASFTDDQGQPLAQTWKKVPLFYQLIVDMPVIFGFCSVLMIFLAISMSRDRFKQCNRLSFVLGTTGIFAIGISFVFEKAWQQLGGSVLQSTVNRNQLILQQIVRTVNNVMAALHHKNIETSLWVIICGVLLFIAPKIVNIIRKPRHNMLNPPSRTTPTGTPVISG